MTVQIIGNGTRAAVGLSALQVAMSMRARKLEPRSLQHVMDTDGNEVGMALCAGLPLAVSGYQRLIGLSIPAALDAARDYCAQKEKAQETVRLPLVMAVPEVDRPNDDPRIAETFISDLASRTELPIDVEASHIVRTGHAAGAFALAAGVDLLQNGGQQAVLVGGVESYYSDATLKWLDDAFRLHTQSSFDGFIPGEAAAFALLTQSAEGKHPELTHAWTAIEPAGAVTGANDDDDVNIAEAMTELVGKAVAGGPVRWAMTDINGERHRVREWSLIVMRYQLTGDDCVLERIPQGVGDIGAASGLLALNNACALWRARCAPADRVIIALHSEGIERGLVVARFASESEEAA